MAYPDPPEISTSYTAAEQALGNGTLPGQEMDVDLAAVRASIASTIEFLKGVTRSDGKLANGIVTKEALASSLIIGFDPPEIWSAGQEYATSSTVFEGYGFYLCVTAHTSSVFATDLASGRWALLADLTPPAGALIAANNLSDLPDASNARANLGLGSAATSAASAFQAVDSDLTALAALGGGDLGFVDRTGVGAFLTRSYASQAEAQAGVNTITVMNPLRTAQAIMALATPAAIGAQPAGATLTSLEGLSLVAGDVLYATGADTLVRLPKGTAGQVLTMNGGATAPEWGGMTFTPEVATTSGATVNISTVIPSGVRRVTVMLRSVSTSSTGELKLRIGNASFSTSSYSSTAWSNNTSIITASDAYILTANAAAAGTFTGEIRLTHVNNNLWILAGNLSAAGGSVSVCLGQITLGGVLDRLQLYVDTGAFDNGNASLIWEF